MYDLESTQARCNDDGFFAQPGDKNCYSITKAGGDKSFPVTLSGSNVQSNFNQNGMAIDSNSKTTSYIQGSQFYEHEDVQKNVA